MATIYLKTNDLLVSRIPLSMTRVTGIRRGLGEFAPRDFLLILGVPWGVSSVLEPFVQVANWETRGVMGLDG